MTHQEYMQTKKEYYALYSKRNDNPENRERFEDLEDKVAKYEIKHGIVDENEFYQNDLNK